MRFYTQKMSFVLIIPIKLIINDSMKSTIYNLNNFLYFLFFFNRRFLIIDRNKVQRLKISFGIIYEKGISGREETSKNYSCL